MEKSLSTILSSFAGEAGDLIPILQKVQAEYGYLSDSAMAEISEYTGVPASRIYAVATFYAQFRFTPLGRNHVTVCRGTACHVKNGPNIADAIERAIGVEPGQTTDDMKFTFETVACLGTCFLAPVIMVDNDYYGHLAVDDIEKILKEYD